MNCGEIYFYQPSQTGKILPRADEQVKIAENSGENIFADKVIFDRLAGKADLLGKGRITQPYRANQSQKLLLRRRGDDPAGADDRPLRPGRG